jgi:integrase
MGTALARRDDETTIALTAKAKDYIGAAKADATKRVYRVAWRDFEEWCGTCGRAALPATPETIVAYVTERAERWKVATLAKVLVAISVAHQAAGQASPTAHLLVRTVMAGIRRTKGVAPAQKAPAVTADLRAMIGTLADDLLSARDRALLLLGFAGAFRRSELVGLDAGDVTFTEEGLVVTLRRSKTDQEGVGRKIGVPYGANPATCPIRALRAWLTAAGITEGPLFRGLNRHGQILPGRLSDKAVARVVKARAEQAGLDPARYSGHSLRAGLATSAAAAGVPERVIANQTGHRSMAVLRRYIREGSLFRENAAAQVGL